MLLRIKRVHTNVNFWVHHNHKWSANTNKRRVTDNPAAALPHDWHGGEIEVMESIDGEICLISC